MVEKDLLGFFKKLQTLKELKRTGWVRDGVSNAESVADHTFRVAFMSMILADKKLNIEKVLKMSLLHELGEVAIGDLVWSRGGVVNPNAKDEKEKKEREAVKQLCSEIYKTGELFDLWCDFEDRKSEEAKFVKQIDKLETAMQAQEYEEKYDLVLEEYFPNSKTYIKDAKLIKIFEQIMEKRK